MRASRLVSLLLLLQTRGRMTAQDLSRVLEVSVRTIYRDVESLSAAGVPVYADRGPAGGYQLLGGYRTRLTGLTPDEAETLFLAGMPGPAAELGLGGVVTAAELKLRAALPDELGDRAGRIRDRFHLDAPGWFRRTEPVPHLAALATAVWAERVIEIRYRRWKAPRDVTRRLGPLGLVLKAGRWYLVARHLGPVPPAAPGGQAVPEPTAGTSGSRVAPDPGSADPLRAYRVGSVLDLEVLDEPFARPVDFDLAAFWAEWSRRYEESVYQAEAEVRIRAEALERMAFIFPPEMSRRARQAAGPVDDTGWLRTVVPIESIRHGHVELLKLGADVEVLAPPELRAAFAETARALHHHYHPDRPVG
ncbi:helix-turn-helix transcriptional regulator [Plantactinospora sonchi]|uniref:WYL domain-containing protein n=1 Tax=Plantactinospora sonchi TaxID=1544735 RepID=A0ABU7RU00_9ACTN